MSGWAKGVLVVDGQSSQRVQDFRQSWPECCSEGCALKRGSYSEVPDMRQSMGGGGKTGGLC